MKKHFSDANAVCPFYRSCESDGQRFFRIRCEGIVERSATMLCFRSRGDLDDHANEFCSCVSGYKLCPIAQVVLRRYALEEQEETR